MSAILKEIEVENLIFYTENCYDAVLSKETRKIFSELKEQGKIESDFQDDYWNCNSDVKHFGISFDISESEYHVHGFQYLKINFATISDMLRCYAVFNIGEYIFLTVDARVQAAMKLLTQLGNPTLKANQLECNYMEEFLIFIATPENLVQEIMAQVLVLNGQNAHSVNNKQRNLAHMLNYLAIENEIKKLYASGIDVAEKVRYFPILFWVSITFILPLRATEILLTPFDCIEKVGDKTLLTIRRTNLKKGRQKVYYDIEKDYREFSYEIPNLEIVKYIEEYQALTGKHQRRFLFDYNECSINKKMSLQVFNKLLAEFIEEKLFNNHDYDFARFAAGIDDFEIVTAGDSRPIAMSNLYFQNAGADICRQIANHEHIDVSAGYYTNIKDTLMCSSIMQLQNKINFCRNELKENAFRNSKYPESTLKTRCLSEKRIKDPTNIEDCIAEKHLAECIGCRFYVPDKNELDALLAIEGEQAQQYSDKIIDLLNHLSKKNGVTTNIEELMLHLQTHGNRYKKFCDMKTEETYTKWEETQSTMKKNY